jgi:hypothetical protein
MVCPSVASWYCYIAWTTYRLTTSIMADDHRQGGIEFDDLDMLVVKRADPADRQLVQSGPGKISHRFWIG